MFVPEIVKAGKYRCFFTKVLLIVQANIAERLVFCVIL